jgi:hypothetical protein
MKKWGVVDARKMPSGVCATNVAVVPATVRRRVRPLVYDEALAGSGIVEEERSNRAGGRIARAREMRVDEAGGRAGSTRAARNAGRIGWYLRCSRRKWDDEIAMHAAGYSSDYSARSVSPLARTGAGPSSRHEASILELFDY